MTRAALHPVRATREGLHGRLSDRLAAGLADRIEQHALRAGTRLPSIRRFAADRGVSRSTAVEVFDRLVASGLVEARRGSGYYVTARPRADAVAAGSTGPASGATGGAVAPAPSIDVMWLMRSMLRQAPAGAQPGAGVLPTEWLDTELVGRAVRAVGRTGGRGLLGYGQPAGYVPLRESLARHLAGLGIDADPAQIVTVGGVTHGLDLVLRRFVTPGQTVLVEDPAWFLLFARLAAFGVRLVGVPRGPDGPDLAAAEALMERHQPRLFFVNSVLHNPTGSSLSRGVALGLLQLAERFDVRLVEDDVYGDLLGESAVRLSALDGLRRTIYLGGFSKTLAAGLRVGFVAAPAQTASELTDLKMLAGLTTPELTERVVGQVVATGTYRRHIERLRARVDDARERTARALERMGVRGFRRPAGGMFLWVDTGRDAHAIAADGAAHGLLYAPGSLFSATQAPSTWMRVAAASIEQPAALRFLAERIAGA